MPHGEITSRRHPLVHRCRKLAAGREAGDPAILLDGPQLILDALAAGLEVSHVLASSRFLENPAHRETIDALDRSGAAIVATTDGVLDAASPVRSPSGIVAIGRHAFADPAAILDGKGLAVAAVGVQDPGNLGAILRVADAAGACGVIATAGCADPFGWKSLRAAAGGAFRMPVAYGADAAALCGRARAAGMATLATCPASGTGLYDLDLTRPALLLLGAEGPGLDPALVAAADARLRIEMNPGVESLNVAVAAGVILFEARRQRQRDTGGPRTAEENLS